MKRAFCLAALFLMLTVGAALGQHEPIWRVAFEQDINWHKLAPTGHLIVSTDGGLFGIDPENGAVLWEREDLKGLEESPSGGGRSSWMAGSVPFTPWAILRGFSGSYVNLMDVTSGEDLWSTETLGLKEHYGYFLLPEVGGMLVYAKDKNDTRTVFLVEVGSGTVLWENSSFFEDRDPYIEQKGNRRLQTIAGNQRPLFDSETTMITFMNKQAIRKFNAETGDLIWETEIKAKRAPARRFGYAPMLLNDSADIVYAPFDKTVVAVGTADGSLLWETRPKLRSELTEMQLIPQGLLVKGGKFVDVLDLETGQSVWQKEFKKTVFQMSVTPQGLVLRTEKLITVLDPASGPRVWEKEFKKLKELKSTNFVIRGDTIIVYSDKKLYAINLSDGEYTELAKDLKFEDNETPASLRLRDDGYFLRSSNNVMLVSFSGEQVFHTHYKKPGLGFLERVGKEIAQDVGEKVIGVAAGEGWTTDLESMQECWNSTLCRKLMGGEYGAEAIVAGRYLSHEQYDSYLFRLRFRATTATETYTYMLTNIETESEKGPGLVRVNNLNGTTEDRLILGTKKPEYHVAQFSFEGMSADEMESRLLFKAGKKEIVCYKF